MNDTGNDAGADTTKPSSYLIVDVFEPRIQMREVPVAELEPVAVKMFEREANAVARIGTQRSINDAFIVARFDEITAYSSSLFSLRSLALLCLFNCRAEHLPLAEHLLAVKVDVLVPQLDQIDPAVVIKILIGDPKKQTRLCRRTRQAED